MMVYKPNSSKSLNKQEERLSPFNNESLLSKNFLCLPKQNNNIICLSPHSQNNNIQNNKYTSNFNISPKNNIINKYDSNFNITSNNNLNNISFKKKNLIHEKVEQYKLHPFRRLNLKIVGEDIKQKLIEMHEENNYFENEKICSSPTEARKTTKILKEKYNINNDSIINLNFPRNKENISSSVIYSNNLIFSNDNDIFEKNENKITSCSHVVKLKKTKIKIKDNKNDENKNREKESKKKKTNVKSIKSKNTKISIKYRKILKKKNLYDSMDDNESDEDVEGDVINPKTKYILIFDLLIIILYIYTFFIITINLSTTGCFCSYNNIFNDILFYITDILYILDLIISFFRSYYNFEYKLIKTNILIIKNYLSGDFFLDLLEAIPIFSISKFICFNNSNYYNCYEYEMASLLFFLKTTSIIKVFKIIKILGRKKNQALDNFLELISENYTIERTSLLIIDSLIFIGIIHCFVCFHIFIGKHSYSNWILETSAENESFFYIYIESLYFLITTLTTVGYGDITCHSFGERIFHILLLAVGSIFYSYIISTIGNYIKNDSHAKIKYNNDLNILENIRIAYPNMPFKLYKNINKYLESKSSSQEKCDVNLLIDTLPFTLKNTILFTMYKSVIKNFKFFKNNDNSEFIARVLTNFIPVISKKNDFLIYEGEIVEEIIFIKDGRISLNAAINLEEPAKSIIKYFNEKFSPFTSEEEKKLLESRLNENNLNKSAHASALNGEITYDAAKSKINNAFKTIKDKAIEDRSFFFLNNNFHNNDSNDFCKFDINGGAIKNEDGNYQYLKIIDIRKNEHFGCVFMTLKKPCPLSLQVKSKFAELYLFKKEEALTTSKSYPNIWKKLYRKEFHNLRAIKNLTFKILEKYIEINQLLLDLNLDEAIRKKDLTIHDLNELEKSLFSEKSCLLNTIYQSRKSINGKKEIQKYQTMNSDFDKKNKRLSLGGIYVQNQKDKLFSLKNNFKGGNLYSNSIIYTNSNRDTILKLGNFGNNIPFASNQKAKNPKVVHFSNDVMNKNKNEKFIEVSSFQNKNINSNELYSSEKNEIEKTKINKITITKGFNKIQK